MLSQKKLFRAVQLALPLEVFHDRAVRFRKFLEKVQILGMKFSGRAFEPHKKRRRFRSQIMQDPCHVRLSLRIRVSILDKDDKVLGRCARGGIPKRDQ